MKIEEYHGSYIDRVNKRDARIAVITLVIVVLLMLAGWLHTWFITRPMYEEIIAQQEQDLDRADELLQQASEMLEEIEK